MSELAEFMVHTVTVQPMLGAGGMGAIRGAPMTLSPGADGGVFVDDRRRLVRALDGTEVVSETTVHDVNLDHAALFTPGSLVTLPSGRVATVIVIAVHDSGDLDLPDHLEVALT